MTDLGSLFLPTLVKQERTSTEELLYLTVAVTCTTSRSISSALSVRRMHSSRNVCSQKMTVVSNHAW